MVRPLRRLQRQRRRQERGFGRNGAIQNHQPAALPDGRPGSRRSAGRLGQERRPARARLPFRHARSAKLERRPPLPGLFSEMAGIRVPRFESLNSGKAGIRVGWSPQKARSGPTSSSPRRPSPSPYGRTRSKFYSGSPCVTVNERGEGRVWYIGTSPDPLGMFLLYRRIFKEAKVGAAFRGMGIEIVERRTDEGGR